MTSESLSASRSIDAAATAVFAILANPANHAAIDGTGWVREPREHRPLTQQGQIFIMAMYHDNHPSGDYEMANRVRVYDPPRAISWEPGQDRGDGSILYGGWTWSYALEPVDPHTTEVTLTYDWSAVPGHLRQVIDFPPFGVEHLSASLNHLAQLSTASA